MNTSAASFVRKGGSALAINRVADHVHILAKLRQDKALADLIRDFKSNASHWMHHIFPEQKDFAWQSGYGAFTVSASQVAEVIRYIANQEQHHQKRSFRDEFTAFLQANEINFDEKYLWK
jgi:putative transposase